MGMVPRTPGKEETSVIGKIALVCALAVPAIATAQPVTGLYVGGDLGINFTGSPLSAHDLTRMETGPGPVGLAAVGWGFGNGLRAELEGSYRTGGINGISTLRTNGSMQPLANVSGDARTYAAMVNVAYDIPFHPFALPVQPYVGAGIGYGWLGLGDASGNGLANFAAPGNNSVLSPDTVTFGTGGAFAYQAFVGASVPLPIAHLSLTVEYRYFGTALAEVPVYRAATGGNTVNGAIPSRSSREGFSLGENAVLIGLRYEFGAPQTP
jgi:opacity protein-like surface antigen